MTTTTTVWSSIVAEKIRGPRRLRRRPDALLDSPLGSVAGATACGLLQAAWPLRGGGCATPAAWRPLAACGRVGGLALARQAKSTQRLRRWASSRHASWLVRLVQVWSAPALSSSLSCWTLKLAAASAMVRAPRPVLTRSPGKPGAAASGPAIALAAASFFTCPTRRTQHRQSPPNPLPDQPHQTPKPL